MKKRKFRPFNGIVIDYFTKEDVGDFIGWPIDEFDGTLGIYNKYVYVLWWADALKKFISFDDYSDNFYEISDQVRGGNLEARFLDLT